ncbi:MAG TPA: tripartite tricarboxylate transporter substrate binding protein [Burkholderiales bacterium]|jgi:tripartite-type tricarboxylate transporter receptor subunit TctC|nr:tripartite tricarboxylate transporter substrate binding protein [Burkholderiales bacterium]
MRNASRRNFALLIGALSSIAAPTAWPQSATAGAAARYPSKPIRMVVPFAEAGASGLVSRRPVRGEGARAAGFNAIAFNTPQAFPSKPIRMVVPFAAGGGADIVARALGQKLNEAYRQPVVVDNRAGGTTIAGTDMVAKAAPDGYTLLMATSGHVINPSFFAKLPFDAIKDFAPVTQVTSQAYIFGVYPGVPAKSVSEFVALAKSKPGQLNYASGGNGNATHLGAELLKDLAGIDLVHVPYKGGGPALIALISGEAAMLFSNISFTLPQIKAGKVRALAVTSAKRSLVAPELPTVAEAGVPGFELTSWYGVLAPAKTPKVIIASLHDEIVKGLNAPDLKARLANDGNEAVGSTPEAFAAYIAAEIPKWARVINKSGARME